MRIRPALLSSVAVVCLFGAGTAVAAPGVPPLPVQKVHISGRVTDASTGAGIKGMCVRAGLDGGGASPPTATDPTGHYQLDIKQDPGSTKSYTVFADANCGANKAWFDTADDTLFWLTAKQGQANATGKNLSTTRAGRMSGRITDAKTGSAISGAEIYAFGSPARSAFATTGADGAYLAGPL